MPFQSQAQRAWMYQHDPEMAKRWEAHTPKGRKLPKRKKRPTVNRSAASRLKADPSQTYTLRKRFETEVKRRFNRFKSAILDLVKREDAFGLTANFNPDQPRDNRGRWSSGGGKAVMYRGIGEGADTSSGFEWFSETPELATKYAEFRGGKVVSQEVEVQKPLIVMNPKAVTDARGFFAQATKQADINKVDKVRVKAAREEFNKHFGEQPRELIDYWSNPEAKLQTRNLLEALGYDSIVMQEGNENTVAVLRKVPTVNTRWKFRTNPAKVEEFRKWLQKQAEENLIQSSESTDPNKWWDEYVLEAYRKGQLSSFEAINKQKLGESMDFYKGTKEQFLRDSFAQPETKEKIQLLAGRVFTDLKGVTEAMATAMTRTLTDGLSQGQNPFTIARQLVKDVEGIGVNRARMIARTEVIRAHAEGQLDALETMGIEEVGVAVEWDDAGDGRVCRLCSAMDGVVLTVKEAHGLIPRHPNCRCAFLPANVGESKTGQIRGPKGIQGAFDKSIKREIPKGSKRTLAEQKQKTKWGGADTKIVKKRPKSIV